MAVSVDGYQRERLLRWASAIPEDPTDASAVAQAAFIFMDWAEQAGSELDFRARMEALNQHWQNVTGRPRTGDAQAFVEQAKILYDFAAAGTESQVSP